MGAMQVQLVAGPCIRFVVCSGLPPPPHQTRTTLQRLALGAVDAAGNSTALPACLNSAVLFVAFAAAQEWVAMERQEQAEQLVAKQPIQLTFETVCDVVDHISACYRFADDVE